MHEANSQNRLGTLDTYIARCFVAAVSVQKRSAAGATESVIQAACTNRAKLFGESSQATTGS